MFQYGMECGDAEMSRFESQGEVGAPRVSERLCREHDRRLFLLLHLPVSLSIHTNNAECGGRILYTASLPMATADASSQHFIHILPSQDGEYLTLGPRFLGPKKSPIPPDLRSTWPRVACPLHHVEATIGTIAVFCRP